MATATFAPLTDQEGTPARVHTCGRVAYWRALPADCECGGLPLFRDWRVVFVWKVAS